MAHGGLLRAALLIVCLLVVCRADDLMMEEDLQSDTRPSLDLVFLVHNSKRVSRKEFQSMKDFMKLLIRGADIDSGAVRVAYAVYRKRGRKFFGLNQFTTAESVLEAVDELKFVRSKKASVALGMYTVRSSVLHPKFGDRKDVPNVVIIITDEASNVDKEKIVKSSNALKRRDTTTVFTIGVGMKDKKELETVASGPNGVLLVDSMYDLLSIREELVKQVPARKEMHGNEYCKWQDITHH